MKASLRNAAESPIARADEWRDAVMQYFGFEALPIDIPERFWVFDKPRQVTIILAEGD